MKKSLALLAFPLVILPLAAHAADGGRLKAGLWEVTLTKRVRDGQDMSDKMTAAQARMRAMMEKMSPEQRQKMESMMGSAGAGSTKVCVSPAMASSDRPIVDQNSHCEPAKATHSGNTATFEFTCSNNGRTTHGTAKNTVNGDTASSHIEMTTTEGKGGTSHKMEMESTLKYLGADCKGIKPYDEMAKGAQGAGKP